MKVLILQSELGVLRGGGETFTRNLFTAFAGHGHTVEAAFVADRSGNYPVKLPACMDAMPIRGRWSRKFGQAALSSVGCRIPADSGLRRGWDRLQEAIEWRAIRLHDRRFQERVERRLAGRWRDFDAVYVHGNVALAARAAQWRPTVLRLPGPISAANAPILRRIQRVCANGDALSCLRQFMGETVSELPIGIDQDLFSPGESSVRRALGWSDRHLVVGFAGRLTRLKGIDVLAAAFRDIPETSEIKLLIVGSGEETRNVRSVLAAGIARRSVHIQTDVDQERLPEWYRAMNLLVMPSRYENCSNAVLEAMACGVPFVASDIGGNRTYALTGAGWLVERESAAALSTILQRLNHDRGELRTRGEVGRRWVEGRYSWGKSAECLERIIRETL